MKRATATIMLAMLALCGCASVPTYNISAEQFRTLYEAPRQAWEFADYNGKYSGHYWLTLYGLKYASWPEPLARYRTPVSSLGSEFPTAPQGKLIQSGEETPEEQHAYLRAISGLPRPSLFH